MTASEMTAGTDATGPIMKTSGAAALLGVAAIAALLLFAPPSLRAPLIVGIVGVVALRVVYDLVQRARLRDLSGIASAMNVPPEESAGALVAQLRDREQTLASQIERLGQQRRGLREVLDGVGAPVIAIDSLGRIRFANRPGHRLLGSSRDTLIGAQIDDVLPHRQVRELLELVRIGGDLPRPRLRLADADNTLVVEVVARAVRLGPVRGLEGGDDAGEPDDHGVAITLRDVTELDQAVQLKSDFASNASHELRTPVASIRGATETLSSMVEGIPDDAAMAARLVNMIGNNARRLEEMLSDLLDLSRLESPDQRATAELVDLPALGVELRDMFAERLDEHGLSLEFDIAPGLERFHSDRSLLELILRNLIENACKHARDGTSVRVVARLADIPLSPDLPPPPAPEGDQAMLGVRLRVMDQGTGIPLRDQQRIFERFYQVDPARSGQERRRGTGLGLAIVKHATRRLGGRVGVESVWQQGTTMIVELPGCVPAPGDETLAALEGPRE